MDPAASKKRRIGDECRVFNENWTHKYFFYSFWE